jgi:RpiB/LacA/LacB family sugar-phosphate isomerase
MKIAIGSDHAGWEGDPGYKATLLEHLKAAGHEVTDLGPDHPDPVDYPDFAQLVADALLEDRAERGIIICGTGIGMCMAANRNPGIRAAVCWNEESAKLSREHNNANVLCLGRRLLSLEECLHIADTWLATPFSGAERHERRVAKMDSNSLSQNSGA